MFRSLLSLTVALSLVGAAVVGVAAAPAGADQPELSLPSRPHSFSVSAHDGGATAIWQTPATDGGHPIIDYVARYRPRGSDAWGKEIVPATQTWVRLGGLENGVMYEVRVRARTSVGAGRNSSTRTVGVGLPTRVRALRLVPQSAEEATLTFAAPGRLNGATVVDYFAWYRAKGEPRWTRVRDGVSTDLSITVPGLTAGVTHRALVRPYTDRGFGPPSRLVAGTQPDPPPPTGGTVLAIGDSVMLGSGPQYCNTLSSIRGWNVSVNATVSRQWFSPEVPGLLASAGRYDRVVIGIGTNGPFGRTWFDQAMTILGSAGVTPSQVVWVTVQLPASYDHEAPTNALIRAGAGRWGAKLADWNAVTDADPSLLSGDGIHLTCTGAITYASLIAAQL